MGGDWLTFNNKDASKASIMYSIANPINIGIDPLQKLISDKTDKKSSDGIAAQPTQQAQDIEAATRNAELLAEQRAKDETRKKLAKQTKTIYSSAILGSQPSTLGSA